MKNNNPLLSERLDSFRRAARRGCLVLITLLSIGWSTRVRLGDQGFVPADVTIICPFDRHPQPRTHSDSRRYALGCCRRDRYRRLRADQRDGGRGLCASARRAGQNGDTVFRGEEQRPLK